MSPVDNGKNIVKHWLSSGEVVSSNQRCWHRNNYLRRFIEDKGLLSTSILVKRQREGWGKKLCSVIQVYLQRHLTTVDNILLQIADMKDLLASQNSKIFFPRKRKTNLGTFNITLKLNSLVLLKKRKTVFLHIYLLTCDYKSCLGVTYH